MPYTVMDGFRIYFEDYGLGEPVVLLHHGFGCTRMWEEIAPRLIEAGYRVILYDRRGYGRSDKGDDFQSFYVSRGFRAAGVRELAGLTGALGLEAFHLVGQCEGGVVAVDYALDYPEQVLSAAVSSTQCYSKTSMQEFNRENFPKKFDELEPHLRKKLEEWHGADHAERFFNQFRIEGGSYGTGVFDLRPLLPSVTCPALVLYPDRSFLFEVEQGVAFYRHLPRGELAVIPKCGHNTYEQRPEEYCRAVLGFLERRRPEREGEAKAEPSPSTVTCIH